MALVCKWLIFQGSSIKVYPPILTYVEYFQAIICKFCLVKKSFKISFNVHLKKTASTQLIFCFDLASVAKNIFLKIAGLWPEIAKFVANFP